MKKIISPFGDRSDMTDDEFVRQCGILNDRISKEIASGIRRAIARLGNISPLVVYPADTFRRELSTLPFWSSLDAVEFLCALSEELGIELTDEEAAQIPNPEWMPTTYDVKGMIQKAINLQNLRERLESRS